MNERERAEEGAGAGAGVGAGEGSAEGEGGREPTNVRANLRRSMIDGTCWAIMVGLAEMYFGALVLALGHGEVAAALVVSIPPIVGGVLQLVSPWGVKRLASHKRWTVLAAGLQAVALVPLAVGVAAGVMPAWLVFVLVSVYYAGGLAAGTTWSTWIGTLVPARVKARFFGRRQRLLQVGTLAGFLVGGAGLYVAAGREGAGGAGGQGWVLMAFAVLLGVAAVCRGVSALLLARKDEPVPMPGGTRAVSPVEFARRLAPERSRRGRAGAGAEGLVGEAERSRRAVRLIVYMLSVTMTSTIAAAFIVPYLREQLRVDYWSFAMLVGTVMLGKAAALGAWGALAHRAGPRVVLVIGAVGLVPVGWMWTVSAEPGYLFGVQVYSGVVWAAWELATFLYILSDIDESERTSLMSLYVLGNTLATAGGALIGAWLLKWQGKGTEAYMTVFWVSTAARALTLVLLAWMLAGRGRGRGKG